MVRLWIDGDDCGKMTEAEAKRRVQDAVRQGMPAHYESATDDEPTFLPTEDATGKP